MGAGGGVGRRRPDPRGGQQLQLAEHRLLRQRPGKIAFDQAFSNPISAAEQTANFLKGKWGGASSSIRAIIDAAGKPPQDQLAAIINSDWTGDSHYGGGGLLHSTFDELGGNMKVTQA